MLQLTFKEGTPKTVDLTKTRITIGRDGSNDQVLTAQGVSGFHAEIQCEGGRAFLVDLGSTNGTWVNGRKITGRQELKAWDTVRFEKVEAEVVDSEGHRPTMVSRAISDDDLKAAGAPNATQVRPAVGVGFSLKGVSQAVAGKSFPISGKMVVGREASCDLQIDEQLVSRRHAEIELLGGVLKIRDLASANGTFVNGQKVTETTLKAGDEVKFDQVVFKVEGAGDDAAKTSLRPAVGGGATGLRPAAGSATMTLDAVKASLSVSAGPLAGKRFELKGLKMNIGRTAGNDIVLDDATVSSSHAVLIFSGGGWKIEDAGSSNGTFVNGARVSSKALKGGDTLRLGKVELKFDGPAAAGTQVFSAVDDATKTSVLPVVKKRLPVWAYGLVAFVVVGLGLGGFFFKDKLGFGAPAQISAKLQGGKVWAQQLSNGRMGPTTPLLADINGDKFLDVIVADASGYVLAMDGQEGKKIFEAEISDRILAPPMFGDLTGDGIDDVIVASNSGVVVALNGKGKILWKSSGELDLGEILNRPVLQDLNGDGIPDVIVPTANKGLVALDGAHGWKLWDTAEMTRGKMITSPIKADVNGDKIIDFVGVTDAGQVLAVTGQGEKVWQIWEGEVPPIYYGSPLLVTAGDKSLVVVATDAGGIFALNAENGRMAWSTKSTNRFFASPVAADANGDKVPDVVTVAENGEIHVYDALSGDEIWSVALGTGVQASPALFDVNNDDLADLVILDIAGNLRVVDIARGRELLSMPVTGANGFMSSPVMGDVNNDEMVEVVAAGLDGTIANYGLNRTIRRSSASWPMFLGNDRHALQ